MSMVEVRAVRANVDTQRDEEDGASLFGDQASVRLSSVARYFRRVRVVGAVG